MTTSLSSSPPARREGWMIVDRIPGVRHFKNLSIGTKLMIGFAILVALALSMVGISFLGSIPVSDSVFRTNQVRMPIALISTRAQDNVLRMSSDVRGYLALGEQKYRNSYNEAKQAFETDLAELNKMSTSFDDRNKERLKELETIYKEWALLPDKLFALRDDQLEREPAYKLLATDGIRQGGSLLIALNDMIEAQGRRQPATPEIVSQLATMAKFQGSFASMLSGLRGYTTTRNRAFKSEYEANLAVNDIAWDELRAGRATLTENQQAKLEDITKYRESFLKLPNEIFTILEGDGYRQDLYLFNTEWVPRTTRMQQLLAEITQDQQSLLVRELTSGQAALAQANVQTLTGGIIALVLGLVMTFIFRENIAGPIRRLTGVAEQIRGGALETQARIESGDEIGVLAETFNNMTGQLRHTLLQVRKEKKRADDLLNVVIPIGVALSSEKDFDRLLENILVEGKAFCRADAGILYLHTTDNRLKYVIAHNDTLNLVMGGVAGKEMPAAKPMLLPTYDDEVPRQPGQKSIAAEASTTGTPINIPNAYQPDILAKYGQGIFDNDDRYQSISYLTIPLKNSLGQVVGVLQLINAKDPETRQVIPFDTNLQQMMLSFSSLAEAALEAYIREQGLKQEIQQLKIEIDEVKRQKQVSEIVDSDFFQDLQAKASRYRQRSRRSGAEDENPGEG